MSLNKVMLIGNVGKDPEVRYLENNPQNPGANPKMARFPLATSERYRDRNGEQREDTEWHNIIAWRNSADVIERFVRKGSQVYIEGRLRTRKYTDNDGKDRYTTEIVVENIQLLGKRPEDGTAPLAGIQPQGGYQQRQPQQGYAQGGYQQPAPQPQYQQPAGFQPQSAPAYQPAQPQYQQPAAPAAPVPPAPAAGDAPSDDLPF